MMWDHFDIHTIRLNFLKNNAYSLGDNKIGMEGLKLVLLFMDFPLLLNHFSKVLTVDMCVWFCNSSGCGLHMVVDKIGKCCILSFEIIVDVVSISILLQEWH
ncbi:hypothetical protein ACH5RR_033332 [Cinchona calisaya]|uniref:Uncharacterized protein n=1 Tax=Cinchona calisaya TaxID=153742 RepID=A0ABD2YKP4_9GENT